MANDQAELRQVAHDIALAEAQLRAVGIILTAASFAIADALEAKARRLKDERKAARQAAQRGA